MNADLPWKVFLALLASLAVIVAGMGAAHLLL